MDPLTLVRIQARQLAELFNQDRVYDATYPALAEFIGREFWAADQAFYQAVKGGLDHVRFAGDVVGSRNKGHVCGWHRKLGEPATFLPVQAPLCYSGRTGGAGVIPWLTL